MSRLPFSVLVVGIALAGAACGRAPSGGPNHSGVGQPGRSYSYPVIDLASSPAKSGTAVVLLVDRSGSMASHVNDQNGKSRAKSAIARDSLDRIIGLTETWKKSHSDSHLELGVYAFSGNVIDVLPVGEFDAGKARTALSRIPSPTGNTAIGRAVERGFQALYQTGCSRKYLICITDGANTSGPGPDAVGRQLYEQTQGAVEMHFIAFDVSSRYFAFVKNINGTTHDATDGAQLQAAMTKIYEKRILAEAPEPDK